ncbi:MAG: protein jag [Ruminococcus sp.]|nr:protein jag [Ruminococcus sp.]
MVKEVIGTGDTPELALLDAKNQLGLSETDDVDFEVVQMPEKKVLGIFGGKQAKVKITIKGSPADVAEDFLKNVIAAMGLTELTVNVEKTDSSATFDIEGEEVGFIIGRRGETLDSLQYLTSLVANHVDNSYFKITVNTGNYREKREKTLEILGRKLAYKAVKTGKKTSLEPMNPFERRIIHTSVQKVKGATSWSEGENMSRHVVIGPDPKERRNRGYGNRKGSQRNNPRPAANPERKPIDESNGAGLYGRID